MTMLLDASCALQLCALDILLPAITLRGMLTDQTLAVAGGCPCESHACK